MRNFFAAGGIILIITLAFSANFTSATPGVDEPPIACETNGPLSMPSSSTFKDSEWFPDFALGSSSPQSFVDLNGDGLVDFIYSHHWSSGRYSCVALNNGSGWDIVHNCRMTYSSGIWTFYGDCADV